MRVDCMVKDLLPGDVLLASGKVIHSVILGARDGKATVHYKTRKGSMLAGWWNLNTRIAVERNSNA